MQYYRYLPPTLLNESITPGLLLHRGQKYYVSILIVASSLFFLSFADLHHSRLASCRGPDRNILQCDKDNGESAACLTRAPLEDVAAARWSTLEIATDDGI